MVAKPPPHLPPQWRERLLAAVNSHGWFYGGFSPAAMRLLSAWAQAEGSEAAANPLNCTLWMPGATPYNTFVVNGQTFHVWSYLHVVDGLGATASTFANGNYNGILGWLQDPVVTPETCVNQHRSEFETWGTNPDTILGCLAAR